MHIESSLTLPSDPGSVTRTIKTVNLQIKIWLQSLNQNITFSSFEQNRRKWCNDKLFMVPVWFTGSQPTTMKRSRKFKVTKRMCI